MEIEYVRTQGEQMGFRLSDDEAMIENVVREWARDQMGLEAAHENDRHDRFPEDHFATAAGLGLCGMALSQDEGGAGTTPAAFALAVLETAKVCPSTAIAMAAHNAALRILRLRSEALSGPASGELVALLATEEAHGSHKHKLGTVATKHGDGFVLTGVKVWSIGAAAAKHLLVLARMDEGPTWFHVPADVAGIQLGQSEALLGLRAAGIRTVYLTDVQVKADAMVGEPGKALDHLGEARDWLQIGAAAAAIGATLGGFSAARHFAEDRVQFGRPIGSYQAVSDAVTEVDIWMAAARSLLLEAAEHLGGQDASRWAARAKTFAAESAIPMTRKNIRIQGGTGFMREGGTERFARDVRALQFVGEPVNVQRDTLRRAILDIDYDTA